MRNITFALVAVAGLGLIANQAMADHGFCATPPVPRCAPPPPRCAPPVVHHHQHIDIRGVPSAPYHAYRPFNGFGPSGDYGGYRSSYRVHSSYSGFGFPSYGVGYGYPGYGYGNDCDRSSFSVNGKHLSFRIGF